MPESLGDVLVVEDDPEINQLVGEYAQIAGYNYRAAFDGGAALAETRRKTPSVVILDLMLPDASGFDICRQLKRGTETCGIPIIMLTALDSELSRRRGLECGAAAYLTKPFDPDTLMAAISRHAARTGG